MIRFFRKIRQTLFVQNQFAKYLLYASGEIILVVIGILIALQVNNWNEFKKTQEFETKILKEINLSLKQDLERTEGIYKGRALPKRKAISDLIIQLKSKGPVNERELSRNFSLSGMTLSFYFDKGPFESLKSKGFEKIQNDSLRKEIIRFYEVDLPLRRIFVDWGGTAYNNYKYELRGKFDDYEYEKKDTLWGVGRVLDIQKLRRDKYVIKWLRLEQGVADNYIRRLENLIEKYKRMIAFVDKELSSR